MDWFERLTGFHEHGYSQIRGQLEVHGNQLRSLENGRNYQIGDLELVSLGSLRERVQAESGPSGRLTVRNVRGDVGMMHQMPEYAGALFQVASQFNLLEMVGPDVTPEDGVSRYEHDRTQGPACAIAAGAATIYRNYFVPIDGATGQTSERQLDGLADLGVRLGRAVEQPTTSLWVMRNGYAWCSAKGLGLINAYLEHADAGGIAELEGLLRVGLHRDVEVTASDGAQRPVVSQIFCSALPVAYVTPRVPSQVWQPFAKLVLNAAYEATLWAAVLNARRGASNVVLLTRLGGGAFGNDDAWIDDAMHRALVKAQCFALDVSLVSYGAVPKSMLTLEEAFR